MHFIYFCAKESVMSGNQIVTAIDVLYSAAGSFGARIYYNFPNNIYNTYNILCIGSRRVDKGKVLPKQNRPAFWADFGQDQDVYISQIRFELRRPPTVAPR